MGIGHCHRVRSIDVTFHTFQNAFYWFSSVNHEELIFHNISENGLHTIYKAKVYTSFLRPEQGVLFIFGCVLYSRNCSSPEAWIACSSYLYESYLYSV